MDGTPHDAFDPSLSLPAPKGPFSARRARTWRIIHSTRGARMLSPGDWLVSTPFGECVCSNEEFEKATEGLDRCVPPTSSEPDASGEPRTSGTF